MEPVAVGRFDEDKIGLFDDCRRFLNDAVKLAEVPGEDCFDGFLPLSLRDPGLDYRASKDMPRFAVTHL